MYESPSFRVQLEGGTISLYCQDERLMSLGIEEEYRNFAHKHLTGADLEKLLERMTAEFWEAGYKAGKEKVTEKIKGVLKNS